MHGYVEADEIESKGSLMAVNIRSYGSINVSSLLKSRQFIIAEGSIIVSDSIIGGWSIYSGVWIKTGGFIIARKGSITAVEYIVADGPIIAYSWITCEKKIESGQSIWAGKYIKALEIYAGLNSLGNWEKQIIKTKKIEGDIINGTPVIIESSVV